MIAAVKGTNIKTKVVGLERIDGVILLTCEDGSTARIFDPSKLELIEEDSDLEQIRKMAEAHRLQELNPGFLL